jgi:ABC-type glycerol-3-phosphate transport system substrate-binding protein
MKRYQGSHLLILLIFCAACSANATPIPDNTAGKVILSTIVAQEQKDIYAKYATLFMEQHPSIYINIQSGVDVGNDFFRTHGQDNVAYERYIFEHFDVMPTTYISDDVLERQLLLNLKPLMDADVQFDPADYYTNTLTIYQEDNGIWALPVSQSLSLLHYNRDLFLRLGIGEPQSNWTWADYLDTAYQLSHHDTSGKQIYGTLATNALYNVYYAALLKSELDIRRMNAEEIQFEQQPILEWISTMRAMREEGVILITNQAGEYIDPLPGTVDAFVERREGRLGMWDEGEFYLPDGRQPEILPFQVGRAVYPPHLLFGTEEIRSYVISAGTQHPQEAWQWIEFLSRQPSTITPLASTIRAPLRRSVAEQSNFWQQFDAETARLYQRTLETAPSFADRLHDARLGDAISEVYRATFDNPDQTPLEIVQSAQHTLEQHVAILALTPPAAIVPLRPVESLQGAETPTTNGIRFGIPGAFYGDIDRLLIRYQQAYPDTGVTIIRTFDDRSFAAVAQQTDCFLWQGAISRDAQSAHLDLQPYIDADQTWKTVI